MNNITRYTVAFWANMIICNLWLIEGNMLIAALFLIGALLLPGQAIRKRIVNDRNTDT